LVPLLDETALVRTFGPFDTSSAKFMLNQSRSEVQESKGLCVASVRLAPIVSTIEMGNASDSGPTPQTLRLPGDRENIIMTAEQQQHSSSSFLLQPGNARMSNPPGRSR
jgi:hypothetical protein